MMAVVDLARLASQHHLSEYSQSKYGHKGSPVSYTPLSDDVVRTLRERQQTYHDQVRWWPCRPAVVTPDPPLVSRSLPNTTPHAKTSESHPLNVSPIIPPESLVAISSHLTPCKQPSPVLFELHAHQWIYPLLPIERRSSLPFPLPSPKLFLSLKRNLKIPSDPPSPSSIPTYALHPHSRPPTAPSPPNKTSRFRKSSSSQKQFRLGNLLLSSCPGKKVRLNGPVRGRSAVCRDLHLDLRRMKLLGARCIVCCLDDDELEFLIGASWIEYCQVAHREGLDVLRIPLPEGLTPLSPKSLDADLDRIIERYTLQGTTVLVHCRGGVGRAGLFACCWMLKLGLCGWIETEIPPSPPTNHDDLPPFRWDSDTVVRRDTLQLVERAIEVVRRRRSIKAIETLEQVQFLVEYIEYLRTCTAVRS